MTSEARVAANRRNAAKSTGPRTTEGKAVVAQNAVKHGLWARQAVLRNEDPQEFDLHRTRMLQKLAPDGPEEEAMAERIVALWWRLKRAERMQDEALDYLLEADRGDAWVKCRRENRDPSARTELNFGRAVARDFAETRTLDRLSMHERRIESSLYRTMKELRQLRREEKGQDGYRASSSDDLKDHGWQRQAEPAELAAATRNSTTWDRPNSFDGADSKGSDPPKAHGQMSLPVPPGQSDSVKQSQSRGQGVQAMAGGPGLADSGTRDTASAGREEMTDSAKQSQSGEDTPCETKPIAPAGCVGSGPVRASQETPCGVTTNGGADAKQSQCPKPAAGAGTMLRPRPRVAYHCHDIARSY